MSLSEGSKNWNENREVGVVSNIGNSGLVGVGVGQPYAGEGREHQVAPYRWAPCPEWEQTGRCKYNEMCYRRHGPDDTRLVPYGWEKKRSMRAANASTMQVASPAGVSAVAGPYAHHSGSQNNAAQFHSTSSHSAVSGHHALNGAGDRANQMGVGQSPSGGPHAMSWSGSSNRPSAPRPAAPNPSKNSPSHASSQHAPAYQPMSPSSYHHNYSSVGHVVGSPDSYDSELATSPTVLSPSIMSPLITSPTLSQRMSLSSSPRETYEHAQTTLVEKPWIWQPCRHWQDSGSCRYGDSCKYRHGPEDRRERPAPRPAAHTSAHLMRSTSNSSMDSIGTFSTTDSHATSRPNISLQPIGAQITSPNNSMGTLPPFQPSASTSSTPYSPLSGSQGNVIWDLFAPSSVGRLSPQLGENSTAIVQSFSDQLRNLPLHHPDSADFQSELNSIHIQSMIAIQLQRENFLPITVQESMRVLLSSIAISSNAHEWQFALVKVLDFLNALLDHLFNKFVSVSISSPSSSFGQLPVDIPSKLSLIQPYIGGRLSGSIQELYDLGSRAANGHFAPTQEEVITILEQIRRVAASTSKSV